MLGSNATKSRRGTSLLTVVGVLAAALAGAATPVRSAPANVWNSPLALGPTDAASVSAADGILLAAGRRFTVPISGTAPKPAPGPRRSGLFRSTDQGASWTLALAEPEGDQVPMSTPSVVEVAPGGERAYAVLGLQVWRSDNAGRTFRPVGSVSGTIRTLDALPDGRVVAGLATGGLRVSADGGETWTSFGGGLPSTPVNQVLYLGGTILVATGSGIYRSTDGGTTFVASSSGMASQTEALGVAGDAEHGVFVAVPQAGQSPYSTMTAIYWSPDLGATWTVRPSLTQNDFLPPLTPGSLALALTRADQPTASLYAGTVGGLHVSVVSAAVGTEEVSAAGLNWEQIGPEPGTAGINALEVADVDPSVRRQDTVFAAVDRASIFLTGAGGERWATPGWFDVVNGARLCGGLEVQSAGRLYASCGRHVLASPDGGATWNDPVGQGFPYLSTPFVTLSHVAGHSAPEVGADGSLWVNDWFTGLLRLPAGSERWEKVPHPDRDLASLVAHPTDADVLYAASIGTTAGGVVWRTEDRGTSWRPILTTGDWVQGIVASANAPDRVLVLSPDESARLSTDRGTTWTEVQAPVAGFHAAAFSEADPMIGYASRLVSTPQGASALFLRTRDGGSTWALVGERPQGIDLQVVPSPWDAETVYVHGQSGPMVTRDAGQTWQPFASGLPRWDEAERGTYDSNVLGDIVASPYEEGVVYMLAGVSHSVDPYAMWVYRAVDHQLTVE